MKGHVVATTSRRSRGLAGATTTQQAQHGQHAWHVPQHWCSCHPNRSKPQHASRAHLLCRRSGTGRRPGPGILGWCRTAGCQYCHNCIVGTEWAATQVAVTLLSCASSNGSFELGNRHAMQACTGPFDHQLCQWPVPHAMPAVNPTNTNTTASGLTGSTGRCRCRCCTLRMGRNCSSCLLGSGTSWHPRHSSCLHWRPERCDIDIGQIASLKP